MFYGFSDFCLCFYSWNFNCSNDNYIIVLKFWNYTHKILNYARRHFCVKHHEFKFLFKLISHVTQSTFLSLFNDFSSPDKFATFNLHSLVLTKDLVKLIYVDTFWALNPDPRRWHFFVFTQRCSMINCSKPVVAFVQKHDLNAQMRSWRSLLKTTILFAPAQIELESETETHIRSFCSILYRVFTFLSFTVVARSAFA